MNIVPVKILQLLQFSEEHSDVWTTNAASIGLSAGDATAFKNSYTAAKTKYDQQQTAIAAARAAGANSADAIRDLRRSAADTIRLIKAFAEQQNKPNIVYGLAQIPAPSVPVPLPPPGRPFDFTAQLEPIGAITLRWKCEAPGSGTVYIIRRKLAGATSFQFLNAAGKREYRDATVPAGAANATYLINGQRSDVVGPDGLPFSIMFGVTSGGGLAITAQGVNETGGMKMAA